MAKMALAFIIRTGRITCSCTLILIAFFGFFSPICGLTATARAKEVESVYAWWCMFAETSRPDSVICPEWIHQHKTREPKQYIEGHESFHAVHETEEMYRAYCKEYLDSSVVRVEDLSSAHHTDSATDLARHNQWATQGESLLSSERMSHCPTDDAPVRLVLIVGVEGAGHHLLSAILDKATDYVFRKGYSPDLFLTDKNPESNPRIIAQRIKKDATLRPIIARAPYSTLRTIVFTEEPFPSGGLKDRSLTTRVDLSAFARLKWHGFTPAFLFVRRHLGMAALSNFKKYPRKSITHELFSTESMAMVINSYFEHLCRALKHDGSNSNRTHAAAVAYAEQIIDPLEESRAMRDGGQGATACYRADFADLCSGKGKAYMEVAWALCIPSLAKLAVFHKCHNKASEYSAEDIAAARKFFESPRNRMYIHASDADMLL